MFRRLSFVAFGMILLATGLVPTASPQSPSDPDEQVVKAAGLATDTAALLKFFHQHSPCDEDRKVIEALIRQLDSDAYAERQQASDELLAWGPAAVPLLKAVLLGDPPLELRRRAQDLVRKIETAVSGDAVAAAARLLAARQAEGALAALLAYLPVIDEAWLEDEILTSLGRLGIKQGEADAKLLAAVQDPVAARRAGVLYLLGRRADVAQRGLIRSCLEDADPLVRERAAQGMVGKRAWQAILDGGAADEAALKSQGVALTDEALLEFLQQRTPDAAEQQRLAQLVGELGSLDYEERERATEALAKAGTAALASLKPALAAPDAEVAHRARHCIEAIRRGTGPAPAAAVVRRLARPGQAKDPGAAVRGLLAFAPFVEDEAVEEDVLIALALLSLRQVKVEPALVEALADPLPARRAAAAHVLGHVGTAEDLGGVRKLLADASSAVQLRAAQGLLAARDKVAVPKLIALLGELPAASRWRVEEVLNRLAGEQAPADTTGAGLTPQGRQGMVQAWQKWWQEQQGAVDLARAAEADGFLGLVTVCEYDSGAAGKLSGAVWEASRNGPARFKIGALAGPMDAQVLSGGWVLIAENGASRVTERDHDGTVRWEYRIVGGNPIACQRLPDGNTFIAMYNQLLEVRPDHSEVYRYSPGPQFYVFGARKTRAGTVICITAQGALLEVDPARNKQLRTINIGQPGGGWCGVEPLPNGNFLVATMNDSTVREVDGKGATVWSFSGIPGVFRATRLPNGHTVVVSMTTREVAEVDRAGTVRWRHVCQGRPWNVHWR
jgi:HEAT repeat protein